MRTLILKGARSDMKKKEIKRYHKQPADKFGNVVIADLLNTEPVCMIYAKYHAYAPDLIESALNAKPISDYEKDLLQKMKESPCEP